MTLFRNLLKSIHSICGMKFGSRIACSHVAFWSGLGMPFSLLDS